LRSASRPARAGNVAERVFYVTRPKKFGPEFVRIVPTSTVPTRKSKFTEQQIIDSLKAVDAGTTVADMCRKLGVSEQTFYRRRLSASCA